MTLKEYVDWAVASFRAGKPVNERERLVALTYMYTKIATWQEQGTIERTDAKAKSIIDMNIDHLIKP